MTEVVGFFGILKPAFRRFAYNQPKPSDMKYVFTPFLLLCSVLLFAGQTVSVSGNLQHLDGNEIQLGGLNLSVSIPVNADGSFAKEFEIAHPGIYSFIVNKNSLYVYLAADVRLTIDADAEDLTGSAKISGHNIAETQYLIEKAKIYEPMLSQAVAMYSLREEEFVKRIDGFFADNTALLSRSTNLSPGFVILEEKHIIHGIQPYYSNYKFMYSYYTKSNVPKAKLAESKVILYDNTTISNEEFFFSSVFRNIMNGKFHKAFTENFNKKPSLAKTYIEEALAGQDNPEIRDYLVKNLSRDIKSNKGKDQHLFEAIMALSGDEKFKQALAEKVKTFGTFVNGSPAPNFTLTDQNGQSVSLEDFKGKYVFLDFWATWCKPCVAEIPSLKTVEEKFKDRNIVFLSVSVDTPKDVEKWKKFLADKQLEGIHLIGDNGWESRISKEYLIQSIPRFVLIDTDGFLIDTDAPRPSNSKLTRILNRLDKI